RRSQKVSVPTVNSVSNDKRTGTRQEKGRKTAHRQGSQVVEVCHSEVLKAKLRGIETDTDNPHCHIVYNRINNEGKLISDTHDYRRNEQVTKALKSRYGFTYGTDKSKTNTRKLRNAERAKYEIHNAVKDALKVADSWQKFKKELAKRGVCLELVYMDKEQTKVQGIRFCKDGYSFKGTQISRGYSFGKLNARFEGMENHVSPRAESMQGGQPSCHQVEQTQPTAEHTQDPWSGISSIGLFAPSNAQTYEPFPEDESVKKKKKKRRRGFSL
ncbi:relaxase/mobilization nuclease domain-containing protein, partial [Segatella copri]|uniref:relaxase/mobilization nuclease domain-containing protein n=1 Tax=Segatella copri TaxID=165179 RepID=UPI0011C14C5E